MHNFTVSNFSRYALNTYNIIDENVTIECHAGDWEEEKVGVWQKI
jgi:hypothetical protein